MPQDAPRRAVWLALSELYLDTDVSLLYPGLAETLSRSPYSENELWNILRHEVHPIVGANLRSTAGVWDGFDSEWLYGGIEKRLRRPAWLRPLGCVFCVYPRGQWRVLAPRVRALRDAGAHA